MLAWSILLISVVAVGVKGSVRPAQANIRIASSTEVTLTSTPSAVAAFATAARPVTRYVVQSGDTLSGIAARFAVRGGWPALYAANRRVIGPDPDFIYPGTVLVLPGLVAPARYTVVAGDTLSGIAARFEVPGGWPALYAANRRLIGPDPNMIHPGTVLTVRLAVTPSSPRQGLTRSRPPSPPTSAPVSSGHHLPSTGTGARAAAGMPLWLRITLLAVGLLIGAAMLAGLVLVVARRRRYPAADLVGPGSGQHAKGRAHIILADHDRLVVACSTGDDTVCVLRPPGEDPKAILRVARLVLPEDSYGELAAELGVPASWPMD